MSMSIFQILATVFGILYISLAAKNKAICFLFGAISCSFWAYESFYNLNLKFDALLQTFYVIMSFYGAYHWMNGDKEKGGKIKTLSITQNILFVLLGLVVSFLSAKIALQYFDLKFAYLDALTTGFSIIATFLLARRYFENWVYWLIINPVYLYIYLKSDATLFAGMSALYLAMAIVGIVNWTEEMKQDEKNREEKERKVNILS